MALDDDIAVLSQAPLFNLLERDALRLVAFASESRTYREGDVLFKKGDRSDGGYVVSRGAIALDAKDDGSPETFLAGPGSLIGQAALFARIERRATATAREPSGIIRVTPSLMRRVLEEFPDAAASIHEAMAEELTRLTEGLERVRQQLIAIDGGELPAVPPDEA
ncbi:Crp/Fnr family transcriptional regulator [Microvirga sp. 3-52]|jgi:CRP-like cAMP-binding protein|uniref:cyclic nucleotide-binding domain-containing protein n=1 Tax=Microvirga sp. 3-52 TaxID=2792425 RepID=UPI001AD02406|nr:Crp/Fnr family transcriptional regulator [Microvirga sp. 3-52]MBO1906057.1 Crp/Fnr family transcriptional regulator [Microvirga sp. 3-52]MBS7453351.1 Crp/Fnr family transcriptional regulator [Microvirga sp. 3-52]